MGRMTDDGRHEGVVVHIFADGMSGSSWAGGPAADTAADGMSLKGELQARTDEEIVAWRAVCTDCTDHHYRNCWHGPVWTRVATEAEHDLAQRRIHNTDRFGLPEDIENLIMADWERHIAPSLPVYPLPKPDDDTRFTLGLTADVAKVLERHGYPKPQAGETSSVCGRRCST